MKGGVLQHKRTDVSRHALLASAAAAMLITPLALLGGGAASTALASPAPATPAASGTTLQSGAAAAQGRALQNIQNVANQIPASTTTVPAPAPTTVPAPVPTTAAPRVVVAPPPTTTTTLGHSVVGHATWYSWHAGECASPTLPHGTTVRVTNSATGASTTCVVTDTEGSQWPRVIDLDKSVFAQIADPGAGVVTVSLSW